jgi:hypothetical protein
MLNNKKDAKISIGRNINYFKKREQKVYEKYRKIR